MTYFCHSSVVQSDPAILHSYSAERQGVAQDLIDFDRRWARIMSERPEDGADTPQFQRSFIENGRYTAGMQVTYAPSALIGPATHQHLATGFPVGARLHSAPVVRLADARPMHLGHAFTADGRWRLIAFAPDEDHAAEGAALNRLCGFLAADPASPLRHNRPGEDAVAQIDLRAVLLLWLWALVIAAGAVGFVVLPAEVAGGALALMLVVAAGLTVWVPQARALGSEPKVYEQTEHGIERRL